MGATAWSSAFGDQAEALAYVRSGSPADIELKKVTLRAAGSFVMGSRTNTFPMSLTNDLTVPVTLGVGFRSDAPQRIRVPAIDPVTIAPGSP
ncbi:hypothetical protein G7085_10240 [Tessaracoccus sp. HDW20]|uniref:hypothetical protein n=1 Tax=Tessaracoccus coleopterorum TaxID=2714950 RepID=UPI0018D3C907|nr:hypothetical protein [Tessaracoccus coleopterorum]NHB84852.1 hypothetical protein [Tessaracoccus coleopterorum]